MAVALRTELALFASLGGTLECTIMIRRAPTCTVAELLGLTTIAAMYCGLVASYPPVVRGEAALFYAVVAIVAVPPAWAIYQWLRR